MSCWLHYNSSQCCNHAIAEARDKSEKLVTDHKMQWRETYRNMCLQFLCFLEILFSLLLILKGRLLKNFKTKTVCVSNYPLYFSFTQLSIVLQFCEYKRKTTYPLFNGPL